MTDSQILQAEYDPAEQYDKLYTCVRRDPALDMKAIFLYTLIAGLARRSHRCTASNAFLASETRMGSSSVSLALRTLEERGLIAVHIEGRDNSKRTIIVIALHKIYGQEVIQNVDEVIQNSEGVIQNVDEVIQNLDTNKRITDDLTNEEQNTSPFAYVEAFAKGVGQDLSMATRATVSKMCAVGKRMAADGIALWEVEQCGRYLVSQGWRTQIPTIFTVEKELGPWRMAGRPAREMKKGNGLSDFLDTPLDVHESNGHVKGGVIDVPFRTVGD